MRIKKLVLHNFGVYSGTNTFEFEHDEPIVLIGGLNGRGKTTFLEAVLLALYGSNSFAFKESKYRSYNKYLKAYTNTLDGTYTSSVEIQFEISNPKQEIFQVQREWNSSGKIEEIVRVKKDNEYSNFLTNNWSMFIENQIPSALSNFYFFDGEKISELAVDQTGEQVKESIRAMLGMTVLDTLKNDLEKNNKKLLKIKKGTENVDNLNKLKEAKEKKEKKLDNLNQRLSEQEIKLESYKSKNIEFQNKYGIKGGEILKEKQHLLENRANLITGIEAKQEELIELASSALPLLMVNNLLSDIKLQAEDEHNDLIMNEALEKINEYLDVFVKKEKESANGSIRFFDFLKNEFADNQNESLYNLSDHALFQTNDLIDNKLNCLANSTKNSIFEKEKLIDKKDDVDNYLAIDIDDKELQSLYLKIQSNEKKINEINIKISQINSEIEMAKSEFNRASNEYSKYVEAYLKNEEMLDDIERKIKYINISLYILEQYSIELQKNKTSVLANTITDCYKQLSNKKTLIQRVEMDAETLDIKYISYDEKEVPKNSLSAGEKQLMVISILWALAICSKKALPVIIDTPLSRMDSMHRTAIVSTYFPQASEQTIILSTDTEIDQNYYELIKNDIGDEFTLIYDEKTKSTSVRKGYLLGVTE